MSLKVKVYNQEAEVVKEIELSKEIFSLAPNEELVHQTMVFQSANQRQVLAHTKDRSEVRGGGKKPWRQKGTGRARAGSSRSPIWRSGGITFGPNKERNFKKNINKKMRQKAIFMVLSDKLQSNNLLVSTTFDLREYKTEKFLSIVKKLETKWEKSDNKRSLLVLDGLKKDNFLKKSAQNIVGLKTINTENINILDLLKYQRLIITEDALDDLKKKYLKKDK